ncbi:ferredoxin [Yinghuangia soli]|uniref:Ferredoxin n=1 Tax=Yinghuangia soli TaxID=2908204 RepID=A0AA41Q170_9ACTN|nr:ferredoxin [Yinghuangia soli]MCF2529660.1 ferredoxin [Yinghuangia soli]
MSENYWNPVPTAQEIVRAYGVDHLWFGGKWAERNWRNVPGPFYGAMTDTCWTGRMDAPDHVAYDDRGGEFVYRQPRTPDEVRLIVAAADADPVAGYGWDGDDHWTVQSVRDWWAARDRVRAWAVESARHRTDSGSAAAEDAADGLHDYIAYIDGDLERDLRRYMFWLDQRRAPLPGEPLPEL